MSKIWEGKKATQYLLEDRLVVTCYNYYTRATATFVPKMRTHSQSRALVLFKPKLSDKTTAVCDLATPSPHFLTESVFFWEHR